MNSMVSTCLKRQSRTRTRRHALRPSPTKGQALHIIPELSEEDESQCSTPSSSRCASPSSPLSVKAKRRHGNLKLSDIRVAKDIFVYQDDPLMDNYDLSSPRPAPSPPSSPSDLLLDYTNSATTIKTTSPSPSTSQSRSSFQLNFTEMAFDFPQPPLPTPSMPCFDYDASSSSSSASPESYTTGLPTTPTSSDDEFFISSLLSPPARNNSIRNSVRPLTIAKINPPVPNDDIYDFDISVYASPELRQPFKNEREMHLQSDYDSFSPAFSDSDASDSEEASDWYARELSDILTLCSPMPPTIPSPPARPESMSPVSPTIHPSPTRKRLSKPLPELPRPSAQLDPAFPPRRRSIPSRPPPPPPVPAIPEHLLPRQRPPPRMSVPADFDFALPEEDDEYFGSSFASAPPSISSFSYTSSSSSCSSSSGSIYSQEPTDCDVEFDVDVQFELDMDQPMRLPLSLPGSPVDFEADITHAFEELRLRADEPSTPSRQAKDQHGAIEASDEFACDEMVGTGGRVLRSRWSSSTLSSTFSSQLEEQNRSSPLSPGSKLRLYFSGSKSRKASNGGSSRGRKSSVSSPPPTPMTPTKPRRHTRGASKESNSDVMIIGYGHGGMGYGGGIRRRGSTSSCSVAGSDTANSESSSGSSSGLRRKPIPVEMFLRSATAC